MSEQETVAETLRQLRDEVDRLFTVAHAALRKAQAANSDYRAACVAAYSTKMESDDKRTMLPS